MTLEEANEQMAYFKDHPPLHLMVAAYLGVESKGSAAAHAPAAPRTTEDELKVLWATNGGL